MRSYLYLLLVSTLCGLPSSVSAQAAKQIVRWDTLRSQRFGTPDSLVDWTYFSISASDDHNFTAAAEYMPYYRDEFQPCMVRTTNGGLSWTVQSIGVPPELDYKWKAAQKVLMIDSLHVIAIGDSGLIVRTSDAGETWIREDYATPHVLTGINFSDSLHGIIVGGAVILTTSDGGVTWIPVVNPPYNWMVSCRSYGNGKFRAFNYDKGLIHTTYDNWKSWDTTVINSTIDPIDSPFSIYNCEFLGGDSILANGAVPISFYNRVSRILLSTDGGLSWVTQLYRYTYAWPNEISASNGALWLGAGYADGVLYSTNRGATWVDDSAAVNVPEPFQFSSMSSVQVISPTRAIGTLGSPQGYIVALNLSTLSVKQYERQIYGTFVYPNPASQFVNIQSDVGSAPVYLTDVLGRQPFVGVLNPDGTLRIDVSRFRSGIYQVDILYNGAMLHITNLIILPQ